MVVVVGGVVVVVDEDGLVPRFDEVVVVVDGAVVVVGATVVEVLGAWSGALLDADAPGCSLATTKPMMTVAPVAATAASRVSNRRDAVARRRMSGEWACRVVLIAHFLGSGYRNPNSCSYVPPCPLLRADCEACVVPAHRHLGAQVGFDRLRAYRLLVAQR